MCCSRCSARSEINEGIISFLSMSGLGNGLGDAKPPSSCSAVGVREKLPLREKLLCLRSGELLSPADQVRSRRRSGVAPSSSASCHAPLCTVLAASSARCLSKVELCRTTSGEAADASAIVQVLAPPNTRASSAARRALCGLALGASPASGLAAARLSWHNNEFTTTTKEPPRPDWGHRTCTFSGAPSPRRMARACYKHDLLGRMASTTTTRKINTVAVA